LTQDAARRSGSIVLEGLLDGPIPPFPGGKERLLQWESFAREQGVPLRMRFEGSNFNALADDKPFPAPRVHDFAETAQRVIEQLWKILPSEEQRRLLSTVRSTEYRESTKVETVYAITSDGVRTKSRTAEWKSGARASLVERIGPTKLIVLVSALLFGVFYVVSNYEDLTWTFGKGSPDDLAIEADGLAPYVKADVVYPSSKRRTIEIKLWREKALPLDLQGLLAERRKLENKNDLHAWAALDALVVDAEIRIESLDADNQVIASGTFSVKKLLEQSDLRLFVPYRSGTRAVRLRP
jgi:hypothetical protein